MDLRQLRYFIAVAEERNFSKAARRLHVSQPPLSTQIKALEAELGVPLMLRTNRGVSLTPAGQIFLEEVRVALARLERATVRAREAHRGDSGTLTIGFVSIVDFGILPLTLREFRHRYPAIQVHLHEMTTDAQIQALREERLDIGIGLGPVQTPDLHFAVLTKEPLVLAVPSGTLGTSKASVDLRRMADQSFIVPPSELAPGLFDLISRRCQEAGFVPRITQQARQMQTVISLVSCGMGVALVPASVQHLRRRGVEYRTLRGSKAEVEIGLLRRLSSLDPVADRFDSILRLTVEKSPRF